MEIVSAAIMDSDGKVWTLPKPARHHDVINLMYNQGKRGKDFHKQGFVTDEGNYVNRQEARQIADAAGQGIPDRDYKMPELFSEDVW